MYPGHPWEGEDFGGAEFEWFLARKYELDVQFDLDLKPFIDFWVIQRWKSVGLLSGKETLDYLRGRLGGENNLPMRIDVYYDSETDAGARNLRNKIISVSRETKSQMDTEVRLNPISFVGSGNSTFYLRQGKITTFYPHAMKRPDGGSEPLATGLVNLSDFATFRTQFGQLGLWGGNLNEDGLVNLTDFSLFRQEFGLDDGIADSPLNPLP